MRGLITPAGFDLKVLEMTDVTGIFTGMFKGDFDVSEMSLAELVYYVSRGCSDFLGIPVFPLRMFRHGFMFCNTSSGVEAPEDLKGKKIGLPRWAHTTGVWVRGILKDEYGISPEAARWYSTSLHHWEDDSQETEAGRIGLYRVERLHGKGQDQTSIVDSALIEGKVDAIITASLPKSFLRGDGKVKRVIENYKEIEASYYRRTRIVPIMHVLVARRSSTERVSDLPERLFDLFSEAKKSARQVPKNDPDLNLMWRNHYAQEEQQIFREDPWAYGLTPNRHVLDVFLSYCLEQGMSVRKLKPEDLFFSSTWQLSE
jgi:4,5-dihydroxyphthalate decarboxylase